MTDWAALAPAVLEALEREGQMPPRTRGAQRPDTLRFGTHGSLAVNLERGTWTDFETDESGGVIDLVKRQAATDWDGALRWLRDRGLLASTVRRTGGRTRAAASAHVRNDPGGAIARVADFVGSTARARERHGQAAWQSRARPVPCTRRRRMAGGTAVAAARLATR